MTKRKKSTFERLKRGEPLSRKERREIGRELSSADPSLQVVHQDAAGIDCGGESHFVAVPAGRDARPVQEFGTWTADLQRMAQWLKGCGIRTVAMQSTGVYWIGVQEELEKAGLEVYLVNARGTKNLPGRKSDVQECQWLMKLHTYGLLRNSFPAPVEMRGIRTVWRLRERIVQEAARRIQQMQKALISMNLRLSAAVSDISGASGMRIIREILKGERDPWKLAGLRDRRVRATEEEVGRSLEGHWREEVLFELKQVVAAYDFHQRQIGECDEQLRVYLACQPDRVREDGAAAPEVATRTGKRQKKPRANQPQFDLAGELKRLLGVDLTRIDGIGVMTAQVIYAELGADLSAFPNEAAFCSWLELVPRRDISGGRVIQQKSRRSQNRVAQALRMAAESLCRSDSYLGARYRRLRGRMDGKAAVKAMARYLACLVYRMMTKGEEYVDRGAAYFESRRREGELARLKQKAAELGMLMTPLSTR